ncbi:MAG: alanyl-tRNA editing protein [Sphaerochaeta sp.]|nr:alanyl-tRNA editing protein [Sphaerochaeta sp.]
MKWKGIDAIILDRTVFYPEGGGQPGDRGILGNSKVVDTQSDDRGQLLHIVSGQTAHTVGDTVALHLDWHHRYDYMQQHTAQHLISGTLHRLLGIGTVSVHLGHDAMSVELDADTINESDIHLVEDEVNAIVRRSVPVTAQVVSQEDSTALGLRRPVKVDGEVRIVRIGKYDTIACGGIHVADSSELISVQFLRSERIRGHVRTFWTAGERSVALVRRNRELVDAVGSRLSVPAEAILQGIATLQEQLADTRYQIRNAVSRSATLLLDQQLQVAEHANGIPLVVFDAAQWTEDEFKILPELVLSVESLALCAIKEREDGKLAWVVALKGMEDGQSVFQAVRQKPLLLIGGKGGGKPPLWQGVGTDPLQKSQFLEQMVALYREHLHV